ncbi:hypothetical protein DB347_02475 [Opitutaceae bacterium EW11]|nr:hypothetical protein DB347_02475 [Opitutaceae bacterium EW11]
MKPKPVLVFVGVAVLAAATAGGFAWRRAAVRRAIVTASLPATPEMRDASFVLQERLAQAEKSARSGSVDGLVELAIVYHANGYFGEAARCYEGLEELQPSEARWPHLHASILAGYGENEPAIGLWRRAVELAPDYTPARLRLADALLKDNRRDEAAKVYQDVLARKPGEPYALLGLARIDLEQNRLQDARTKLETVYETSKAQLGYDLIVSVYERLGLADRAAAIRGSYRASGAYRDVPDPWADSLLDDCYDTYRIALGAGAINRSGDYPTALRLLLRAVQLAPKDVSAHFQLGGMYREHGELAKAGQEFQQCTVIDPAFSDGWIQLSNLLAQMGDAQGSERTLLAGLGHCPDSPGINLARGRMLQKAGQIEEAIPYFEASIRIRPNEPDAYIDLANAYIALGKNDLGIQQLHKALEVDPEHPGVLTVLAYNAISNKDRADADRWMTRVANQPNVQKEMVARLAAEYASVFGQPWAR